MSAFILGGTFFVVDSHINKVEAVQTKIDQQQKQVEERATTKIIALADDQAKARAKAEAEAEAQAKLQAEAEAKNAQAAKEKADFDAQKSQVQDESVATGSNESTTVDSPTNSGADSSNQQTVIPPQPTLSFADAGRAIVNQGCSGFFVSPTQVVTASHCALSTSSVQLSATGETYGASISQNIPGKDFAILTVDHPNNQATTIGKRSASAGESVTVYSRLNGVFQASIVTQEVGTVTVNGDGTTQLNFGDGSLGSTINAINAPVSVGDSGSIVIGSDGAYLGVIAGSDLSSVSYFVS